MTTLNIDIPLDYHTDRPFVRVDNRYDVGIVCRSTCIILEIYRVTDGEAWADPIDIFTFEPDVPSAELDTEAQP